MFGAEKVTDEESLPFDDATAFEDDLGKLGPSEQAPASSYRPELPDCGVLVHWPNVSDWYHPADAPVVDQLLPSLRVWHRTHWDGEYYLLKYGEQLLRSKPIMWLRIPRIDVEVGDRVEVLPKDGANEPGIFHVREILFDLRFRQVHFRLSNRGLTLPRIFHREDFNLLTQRHQLKTGFYEHEVPRSQLPKDLERLNVGRLS